MVRSDHGAAHDRCRPHFEADRTSGPDVMVRGRVRGAVAGLIAAAACCAVLAQHSPAHASPSAAERETARNAMDEGDRLRAEGDLRGALGQFMAAHEIMHLPTTGLEVARLQSQLGLFVEARKTALEAATTPPTPDERPVIAQARRAAAKLAEELGPRIPSLTTRVIPADIPHSISIDDVTLSEDARDLPVDSNPGEHEIVVQAPGYQTVSQRIVLVEGSDRMVQLTLIPEPAAEAKPAPAAEASAPAAATAAKPEPNDAADGQRLRAIIALSVGGAALATGVVAGVASMAETGNAKAHCPDGECPEAVWEDDVKTANTLANVANVSIPIGLVAIGYGLFELFTMQPSAASELPSVALSIQPDGARAIWRGTL